MKNRWKSAARACPLAGALFALACGNVEDPQSEGNGDQIPTPIERDTCEDNPLLAGCSEPDPTTAPEDTPDPSETPPRESELELARAAAENVLRANCGQCHGPSLTPATARAGMNYIDNIDALVDNGKITPLSADTSPVVVRMREGSMPPLGTDGPRPSAREIDTVAEFVDNPVFWPDYEPPASCTGQFISIDEMYEAAASDLRSVDSDERDVMRYVTLTNRYNAGICSDQLDRDRFALAKLLNMLSTNASVTPPTPIDDERLIFRIDIRDYNWDRDVNGFPDGWEAIIASSPYAVPFVGDQADDMREDTLTDVPILQADALLDVAAVGDVYYGLIGVDVNQSLSDFIANDLGIDVDENFEDGDVIRAGTSRSQISRQDRVLERHEIGVRQGAYWQSFDFGADDAGESIFDNPFGFNEGGTEAIFTLPNGLLAFIIADENENIVGESDILLDTFQDDFIARTSVSCSNCHALGFNNAVDEVRPYVEANRFFFNRDDFEGVGEIYASPADFSRVIERDSAAYLVALSRAGLPASGSDPVAAAYLRFNVEVNMSTAAGDLGVTPDTLDNNINLLDPALAVLRNIDLDRDDFTAAFEASLCRLQSISNNQPDPDRCEPLLEDIRRR